MLQFPPSLTLDEKFDFLIALAQERNDAKRKAKGAKPECRDKPVVSRTGRVVKPATVACGSVCRQKQNCKITKKQLETVRKQMPGASRREVAEAIKKAMAKKREGMGTAGALYEGTKGARGARGNERIEARKRKGERKAGPKPFLKEMPEMSGDEWEEYGRMVDEGKWAYGNGEPVQVNREGGPMAVDKIKDYRLHRGQRYYQVVPKGARTKPEQHFWAREDQLSPLTSGAKGVKPTRSPGFKDSEVEISWKRGERQVVPSKRIGAIHLATGRLGNPTMVVGGNEVEFSTKKGAASVAKAFHGLIQDAPNLRKVLDEGGSVDLNSASEAQYLFNRALVASEKDLGEKDLGRVEMARKQIGWYEEQQSQGSGASPDYEKKLKELEALGTAEPTRMEPDGSVFFNGKKIPKAQADAAIKSWESVSRRNLSFDPKFHFDRLFKMGSIPDVAELVRAKAGDKAADEFRRYAEQGGLFYKDTRTGGTYDIPIIGANRVIDEWRESRAALYHAGLVDTPDDTSKWKALEGSGVKKWGKGTSETVTTPSMKKWNFHPELEQISERLGYLRRSNVQKGADVVSDYDARIGSIGAYTQFVVVGRSRDGQTVRVEPSDLTKEQKAERKNNPKAYVREVPASSLYNTEATGLLRDRDAMLIMAETGNVPKGWKKSEESVIKAQDMDALARELFERNPHLLRNRQPESGDPAQSAAVGRAKQAKHLYTPEKPRLFNKPVKASSVIKKMTSAGWRDESKYPVSDDELVTEFHNARILQAIKSQWKLFPDLSTDENRALAQFGGADYISKLAAMLEKRGLLKFADDSLVIDFDNLAKLGREKYPHRFQGERQDSRLPYLGFGLNPNPFYHPLWDLMGY